jgi:hypothetical protein
MADLSFGPVNKLLTMSPGDRSWERNPQWRACRVIGSQPMTGRYRSRRPDDPALRERLRALARERRRFGYRRLLIFLRRQVSS